MVYSARKIENENVEIGETGFFPAYHLGNPAHTAHLVLKRLLTTAHFCDLGMKRFPKIYISIHIIIYLNNFKD